ncbi:histidine phosphatase family protein [Agromyces archimandritae]|uniref:Histidine phosphatase family protein n=1 Tax=Agromyces archimandritae TaxID=2781962 RepID=A0A975FKF8_9MICO|nr:histidine phosphatase family protein [Agromyces archimandritae]QTX03614.1 histidine phosphatase family protein [Agromyces archimandritae]
MPAAQIHLVRHGEVENPHGVLYGRLEGFGLSELGHRMAAAAAADLVGRERPIAALYSSPLQRTRESAAPIADAFGLDPVIDERLVEPENRFEGTRMAGRGGALRDPRNWRHLVNPWRPSWGEPFRLIAERMLQAMADAERGVDAGDIVMVSHQLPIWMVHRRVAGEPLSHDPRRRRCALSSITTFERRGDLLVEVGYRDPAASIGDEARDLGAV